MKKNNYSKKKRSDAANLEISNKNLQLQNANKEISEMLVIRTEFINQALHDLRTPLTPILTLLPIVKSKVKDTETIRNLEVIENNCKYLNHLLSELLNFVRTQSGSVEYEFEKININQLIEEVLSNNEVILNEHHARCIKKIEKKLPMAEIDRFKMMEVLQNMLSNAIKFTPEKGIITVTAKKRDNFIKVIIADTGIGMSKKTLSRLFTAFFKADKTTHKEGIGIGLSICKRIIERHMGKIWAESRGRGTGSSIIFEIPITQHTGGGIDG